MGNKILCIVCKEKKLASKDRYEKLLAQYGNEKKLNESYKCRVCRKKPLE